MDKQFVVGLFVDPFRVESLLTNLEEAEFSLHNASVLGREDSKARMLLEESGPLKGIKFSDLESALEKLGVSKENATVYQKAVENGEYLVAVLAQKSTIETVEEMMRDHNGSFLTAISI